MGLVTASSTNFDLRPQHMVIGYYVYDEMERDIADVRDLLVDEESHKPLYVIIEIGGLMSIRGKKILLPWSALRKGGMSRLDINWPIEHVMAAPAPMEPLEPKREEEESIHRHFHVEPYWLEEESEITTEGETPKEKEKGGKEKPADDEPDIDNLRLEKNDEN